MLPQELRLIDSLREVKDVLVYSFDFELSQSSSAPSWFYVAGASCEPFATDATGGNYVVCTLADGAREVLHVDPTGEVGHLGSDVAECCALVVALPYWRDLLRAMSKGATRQQLRDMAERLEREVADDVQVLLAARENLLATTAIVSLDQPAQRFFELNFDPRLLEVVFDQQFITMGHEERPFTRERG